MTKGGESKVSTTEIAADVVNGIFKPTHNYVLIDPVFKWSSMLLLVCIGYFAWESFRAKNWLALKGWILAAAAVVILTWGIV